MQVAKSLEGAGIRLTGDLHQCHVFSLTGKVYCRQSWLDEHLVTRPPVAAPRLQKGRRGFDIEACHPFPLDEEAPGSISKLWTLRRVQITIIWRGGRGGKGMRCRAAGISTEVSTISAFWLLRWRRRPPAVVGS